MSEEDNSVDNMKKNNMKSASKSYKKIILDGWKLFCRDIDSAKWAVIVIIAYFVIFKSLFHTICPLVLFTGFPCPACGLTRAGFHVLHLDFAGAFHTHPFIYPVIGLAIVFFVERYILQKKKPALLKWCAIIVLAGMIVFYVWRMVRYFPDVPPMTYYNRNLLNGIQKTMMELLK